jgi:prepilin-type N-terminal cleavage/methylation domain-containing protein
MKRRGFTLVELLVTMAVMGVIGTALAQLVINNSRFVARQEAQMEARQTGRAALTVMGTELHMVSDSGVLAATPKTLSVRVPYAFGALCRLAGGETVVSLMPVDSSQYATSSPSGVAWRQADGSYAFRAGIAVASTANLAACTVDSIRVVPGGRLVGIPGAFIANPGTVAYLYETVTYRFAASTELPGRVGLWRQDSAGDEEILAPFDTAAGFGFLMGQRLTVEDTVPTSLNDIQGVELRLIAESGPTPMGSTEPFEFDLRARVKFVNKAL